MFCDLALSRRLEAAEGSACMRFAQARLRAFPDSEAASMRCAGAYVVFDGVDSPATQTFGLGVFHELTATKLDDIERFFQERGAPVQHEVSPFAGLAVLDLLCARGYRPIEISNVMFRPVGQPEARSPGDVTVRVAWPDDAQLWADVNARGWAADHPEFVEFVKQTGAISARGEQKLCFLAEIDGKPGASGALCLNEGVALFSGAATVPELRRRGMQTALLEARLRCAFEQGCDLAMMVAEAGSESQRNAERRGFAVAYTRLKWRLGGGSGLN